MAADRKRSGNLQGAAAQRSPAKPRPAAMPKAKQRPAQKGRLHQAKSRA